MPLYRANTHIIKRSTGGSTLESAAYRARTRYKNEQTGERTKSYRNKRSSLHSAFVMAPPGAPAWASKPESLWNRVEATERRKDAQLAREVTLALPREWDMAENVALANAFIRKKWVDKGQVAFVAYHKSGDAGTYQPHVHIMLPLRPLEGDGFGKKFREWGNRRSTSGPNRSVLMELRREWGEHCREHGLDVDHRSKKKIEQDRLQQAMLAAAAQSRERATAEENSAVPPRRTIKKNLIVRRRQFPAHPGELPLPYRRMFAARRRAREHARHLDQPARSAVSEYRRLLYIYLAKAHKVPAWMPPSALRWKADQWIAARMYAGGWDASRIRQAMTLTSPWLPRHKQAAADARWLKEIRPILRSREVMAWREDVERQRVRNRGRPR